METFESLPANDGGIEKLRAQGVISGPPGIGKSTFAENFTGDTKVLDMDPTPYRQSEDWPNNYIDDILSKRNDSNLLLISAHPEVVQALRERGVEVTVVCPDESLKEEYQDRFVQRGHSSETVSRLLERGFKNNEENLSNFEGSQIIFLQSGQYLSDVIDSR